MDHSIDFGSLCLDRLLNSTLARCGSLREQPLLPTLVMFLFSTSNDADNDPDTSFWDGLSVSGFVNQASRGRVTGTATGIPSAFSSLISIGFSNSAAQYW